MSALTLRSLSEIQTNTVTIITDYCQQQARSAASIAEEYSELWNVIDSVVSAGGKRLRPYLTVLAYEASGGTNQTAIDRAAAAWELLHACLLIHDDIIDRDYTRHGESNVAGQYQAAYQAIPDGQHIANSVALIAGDMALSGAYQLANSSGFEPAVINQFITRLNTTIAIVAGGQFLDTTAVMRPISSVDSQTINYAKTAAYSFVGPLCSGAELANAPKESLESLALIGTALGHGYQLADDLLGVFGDSTTTGKPNDSDLREAKRTLLLTKAWEADHIVTERLLADQDYAGLRSFMTDCGAKQFVEYEIDRYAEMAQTEIDQSLLRDELKVALIAVAEKALHRNI